MHSLFFLLCAVLGEMPLKVRLVEEKVWFWQASCFGDLDVSAHLKSTQLGLRDAIKFRIEVHHSCRSCKSLPPGMRVAIEDSRRPEHRYFIGKSVDLTDGLPCHQAVSVNIELHPRGSSNVGDLPIKLNVSLVTAEGKFQAKWGTASIDFPFHAYKNVFASQREHNFLMLGFPGVGKSTFIMSAISALSQTPQQLPNLFSAAEGGHVTKVINRFPLSSWLDNSDVKITLWDAWGLSTFNQDLTVALSRGEIPHGYKMQTFEQDGVQNSVRIEGAQPMDVVLFFVKAGDLKVPMQLKQLKKHMSYVQELGIAVSLVVTWLHTVYAEDLLLKTEAKLNIPVVPFTGGCVPDCIASPPKSVSSVQAKDHNPSVTKHALVVLAKAKHLSDTSMMIAAPKTIPRPAIPWFSGMKDKTLEMATRFSAMLEVTPWFPDVKDQTLERAARFFAIFGATLVLVVAWLLRGSVSDRNNPGQVQNSTSLVRQLAVRRNVEVPSWREVECEAPSWAVGAIVMCLFGEVWALVESKKSCAQLFWSWKFFIRDRCTFWWTSVSHHACTVWIMCLLSVMLPVSFQDVVVWLSLPVGSAVLCLKMYLAWKTESNTAVVSQLITFIALIVLWEIFRTRRAKRNTVLEEERVRPKRERELVHLLTKHVEPHVHDLLTRHRWELSVNIVVNSTILGLFVFMAFKIRSDFTMDGLLPRLSENILGIHIPSALGYTFMVFLSAPFLPLFAQLVSGLRDALRQVRGSSAYSQARVLQRLAVSSAVTAYEREEMLRVQLGAKEPGDDLSALKHVVSPDGAINEPVLNTVTNAQAKRLVDYHLGKEWNVDPGFMKVAEVNSTKLEDAAAESASHIAGLRSSTFLSLLTGKLTLRFWQMSGFAVVIVASVLWKQFAP